MSVISFKFALFDEEYRVTLSNHGWCRIHGDLCMKENIPLEMVDDHDVSFLEGYARAILERHIEDNGYIIEYDWLIKHNPQEAMIMEKKYTWLAKALNEIESSNSEHILERYTATDGGINEGINGAGTHTITVEAALEKLLKKIVSLEAAIPGWKGLIKEHLKGKRKEIGVQLAMIENPGTYMDDGSGKL